MRDEHGRFVAGTSGNPGGRPRAALAVGEMIEALVPDLIAMLAEMAHDPEQPWRARIAAANALLDRCCGKPARVRGPEPELDLPPDWAVPAVEPEAPAPEPVAAAAEAEPAPAAASEAPAAGDQKPPPGTKAKPHLGKHVKVPFRLQRGMPAAAGGPANPLAGAGPASHLFSGTALSTSLISEAAMSR